MIALPASPPHTSASLLGTPERRPGIAATAYDTAWVASIPAPGDRGLPAYPSALQWLVERQHPDGSWGGAVRYEHDRILSTLAALPTFAAFDHTGRHQDAVRAGTRYLWSHGHLLASEPIELVGFELLVPALIHRARQANIPVPPHLDVYAAERAEKLSLIPAAALYSPGVTTVHSLEFLGDLVDLAGLRRAQGSNGSIGNAPATTAFYLAHEHEPQAHAYLRDCLDRNSGAAPVLHPCETFELLWAAYHLFLAGVPVRRLVRPAEQAALRTALDRDGVSLSPTFPIADADDTAVAILLLAALGEASNIGALEPFFSAQRQHFVSFPHERHASIGVNAHVLHALLRAPGYPDAARVIDHLVTFILDQQIHGLYWIDKWHISPYYATTHVLCVFAELPPRHALRASVSLERAREWLRQTQRVDGSWGFYDQATVEETAYAILALMSGAAGSVDSADEARCAAGVRFLQAASAHGASARRANLPPLWIDKCLYHPTLVVWAVIESALRAFRRTRAPSACRV